MIQTPPPSPTALPEVVVTAARLPPAAGEAAFSVVRLSAAELAPQQRLDEALAMVPGLRADFAMAPHAVLWLAADNVFNAAVEVSETGTGVAGYGPPRSLTAGLRLSY